MRNLKETYGGPNGENLQIGVCRWKILFYACVGGMGENENVWLDVLEVRVLRHFMEWTQYLEYFIEEEEFLIAIDMA